MLYFEVVRKDSSGLGEKLGEISSEQWDEVLSVCTDEILQTIRSVLVRKLISITLPDEFIRKYPFLADKAAFADLYLSCIGVTVESGELSVEFDSDKAVSLGLPSEICSLVENGDYDFPRLGVVEEAMSIWHERMEALVAEAVDLSVDEFQEC